MTEGGPYSKVFKGVSLFIATVIITLLVINILPEMQDGYLFSEERGLDIRGTIRGLVDESYDTDDVLGYIFVMGTGYEDTKYEKAEIAVMTTTIVYNNELTPGKPIGFSELKLGDTIESTFVSVDTTDGTPEAIGDRISVIG